MHIEIRKRICPLRLLPVLLLLFFVNQLEAQNLANTREFYASIGALAGNASIADHYFSSIPFTGPAYGATVRIGMSRRKTMHELSFRFNSAHTNAETVEGQTMDQFYFKGAYTFLYRFTDPEHSSFLFNAGASADFQEADRTYNEYINNYQSYEFIANLNLAGHVGYIIKKGTNPLTITDQFHLPVLSVLKQPKLGGTDGSWETGSWNLVHYFSNQLEIEKTFNQKHVIGLGYILDYYSLQTLREVKQVQQFFEIRYTYRF